MIVQLTISNFAIIKHLETSFLPGLNILSGETGTGKTIIINAMNLILGSRASTDLIRSGCREARVEAMFTLPGNRALSRMLADWGIAFDGELLIKRSLFREGKNKIFLNGSMATLQMLSRLGPHLISISGQHEHQRLLKPENHLSLLDEFAGLVPLRNEVGKIFSRYQSLSQKTDRIQAEIRAVEEKQELARFQVREIEDAQITPGEDEELTLEKKRLQHAETLLNVVSEGYDILYERRASALSSISKCIKTLDQGTEFDPKLAPIRDNLSEIEVMIEDASLSLRDFQQTIDMDPGRLETVEERLECLNRLKRKYGPTLVDVLKFRVDQSSMMQHLDEMNQKLKDLLSERKDAEEDLMEKACELSNERMTSASLLTKAVEKELRQLHMAETLFQVRFEEQGLAPGDLSGNMEKITGEGVDRVEFMICPNVGEELKPLSRIASGGELSRIMLAMKTILAKSASVESIIFDEVDAGISGATAEVIGEKLLLLGHYHQILCITHLPQIATQGETHFLVSKKVAEGRTQTAISGLTADERIQEIARLLGGKEITEKTLDHAREMLGKHLQ